MRGLGAASEQRDKATDFSFFVPSAAEKTETWSRLVSATATGDRAGDGRLLLPRNDGKSRLSLSITLHYSPGLVMSRDGK
jgi:hypothetical protein